MIKNQNGFAPLFMLIAIFLITIGGVLYMNYSDNKPTQDSSGSLQTAENQKSQNETEKTVESTSPTLIATPKSTGQPTKKLTTTPSPVPTDSVCPYNLTKQPGSVKVNIVSQNGSIDGDQTIELQAKSGCKVLLNKSGDKETKVAKQGSPTVEFLAVASGSYTVRSQYKGEWSVYHNTSVNSGQQTTVTVTVNVYTTPTP